MSRIVRLLQGVHVWWQGRRSRSTCMPPPTLIKLQIIQSVHCFVDVIHWNRISACCQWAYALFWLNIGIAFLGQLLTAFAWLRLAIAFRGLHKIYSPVSMLAIASPPCDSFRGCYTRINFVPGGSHRSRSPAPSSLGVLNRLEASKPFCLRTVIY